MIVRRFRRDPPTASAVRDLLDRWVKTGDADVALVAADALRERDHEEAANDLDQAIRDRCRDRRTTRERVFSELLNGGIVIERGEWAQHRHGWRSRRWATPREYLLMLEQTPTHWKFRRGVRRGSAPKPRYVLWERYAPPTMKTRCRWRIWGTYELGDGPENYNNLEDALTIARGDIADMQRR